MREPAASSCGAPASRAAMVRAYSTKPFSAPVRWKGMVLAPLPLPSPPPLPCDPEETLRTRFGLSDFHPWQREAIDALLGPCGRALVVAPTGGGKSLVYQVPAAILDG